MGVVCLSSPAQRQRGEGGIVFSSVCCLFCLWVCVCVCAFGYFSTWQLLSRLRCHHKIFMGARCGQKLGRVRKSGLARKYQWYISTIYVTIVSWYFQAKMSWYFLIFSKYQPSLLLLTYYSNSCISNSNCSSPVPKLLDGAKILPKILTICVRRNNVTDDRQTQTDGSSHKANVT